MCWIFRYNVEKFKKVKTNLLFSITIYQNFLLYFLIVYFFIYHSFHSWKINLANQLFWLNFQYRKCTYEMQQRCKKKILFFDVSLLLILQISSFAAGSNQRRLFGLSPQRRFRQNLQRTAVMRHRR